MPQPEKKSGSTAAIGDAPRAVRRGDAAEQRMAGVGGAHPAGLLVAVERDAHRCRSSSHQNARSNRSRSVLRPARRSRRRVPARRSAAATAAPSRAWRHRHRPAPRTSAIGPSASVPSAWKIESCESFQPWLNRPFSVPRAYSTKPSPSRSPWRSIQSSAPRCSATARAISARSPVRSEIGAGQHHEQRRRIDAAVVAAERHLAAARAISPRRVSCRILPGSASRAGSRSRRPGRGENSQHAARQAPDRSTASSAP